MEHGMALRIFDHLLVNHGWTATGGIYTPATHVTDHANPADEISAAERADTERRSLLARLTYRGKLDPIISRAARLLQADSCLPIRQLAAELGVSERYLSRGLRGALGDAYLAGLGLVHAKFQSQLPAALARAKGFV
jgi:AraC-like DNA-binding protein